MVQCLMVRTVGMMNISSLLFTDISSLNSYILLQDHFKGMYKHKYVKMQTVTCIIHLRACTLVLERPQGFLQLIHMENESLKVAYRLDVLKKLTVPF